MPPTVPPFDAAAVLTKLCGNELARPPGEVSEPNEAPVCVEYERTTRPPLHALLIGISKYDVKPLVGAADVKLIKDFLIDYLGVPENQITTVIDEAATRDGIIEAFQALKANENIVKDDPILIFYAGHGSLVEPPPDRKANGALVQAIIPINSTNSLHEAQPPIPDFTIGALIRDIAQAKGDNITVIFDCCHSSSGSRASDQSRHLPASLVAPLPPKIDDKIVDPVEKDNSRAAAKSSGFMTPGMDTHVLLAACAENEESYEDRDKGHGRFSYALVQLLKGKTINVSNLTYKGFIQRLRDLGSNPEQHPACEGAHTDRIFFDAKVPGANSQYILIKREGVSSYFLQAGHAQGITPGCEFEIYADHVLGPKNPVLGKLVVAECEPYRARLQHIPEDGQKFQPRFPAYGVQVSYGEEQAMNVYLTEHFVGSVQTNPEWAQAFMVSERTVLSRLTEKESAHLTIGINSQGKARFTTHNAVARAYGVQDLCGAVDPEPKYMIPVLRGCAWWSYHLRRFPESRPFANPDAVRIEFYKLKISGHSYGAPILEPTGENLNVGGEAEIVLPDDRTKEPYGFKIINNTPRDLYAYLFCFYPRTQAIFQHFLTTTEYKLTTPSLPHNGCYTPGYGSSGIQPFMYELGDDEIDVGIYKLFLTTEPTEFSSVKQSSPFTDSSRHASSSQEVDRQLNKSLWDAITMTVVQRRHPKPSEALTLARRSEEGQSILEHQANPPSITCALFTGKAPGPTTVRGSMPPAVWFRTPDLTPEVLESIEGMRLVTLSRVQSSTGSTGDGWFDIRVISPSGGAKYGPKNEPISFQSHSSAPGKEFSWTVGLEFDRNHDIWQRVSAGDSFEVTVNASGTKWGHFAQEGHLIFW